MYRERLLTTMKFNKNTIILAIITISTLLLASCSSSGLVIPDEYKYDDLTKYIKLSDYKELKYDVDIKADADEIETEIQQALDNSAETKKLDSGVCTETSIANIDYVGSMDGKEFEGGAGEGYDLDIANSTFIEGFAEALVGHSVGENFDIDVTFPDNYGSADLAGKPAVFNVTINYLSEKVAPELTDEWVANNTIYKTVDEYKDSLNTASIKKELLEKIVDESDVVEYPDKELKANQQECLSYYGESELTDSIKETANETTKQELVLHQLARIENIELTDEGYNEYINKLLTDSGLDKDSFKEKMGISIEEYAAQNNLFNSFLYQNVMDKVIEYIY